MKKLGTKGFGVVEGLLILVIIGLVGFAGWYVWKAQDNTANQSSTVQPKTSNEEKGSFFKDGPGEDWKTYVNNEAGFSVAVPKEFLSEYGSPCDRDEGGSYRPASGVVPTTIVEDGEDFYITESYTYQLTQSRLDDTESITIYDGCEKTTGDLQTIIESEDADDGPLVSTIPITVADAKNRNEIDKKVKQIFGEGHFITGIQNSKDGEWQDVDIDCEDKENLCLAFDFRLRHYEPQDKLVYIALGHSYSLTTPDGQGSYDEKVIDSFKILN